MRSAASDGVLGLRRSSSLDGGPVPRGRHSSCSAFNLFRPYRWPCFLSLAISKRRLSVMLEPVRWAGPRGHQMRCQSCMAENAATRRFLRRVRCSAAFTVLGLWLRERGLRQVLRGCGKPIEETAAPTPLRLTATPHSSRAERRRASLVVDPLRYVPASQRYWCAGTIRATTYGGHAAG